MKATTAFILAVVVALSATNAPVALAAPRAADPESELHVQSVAHLGGSSLAIAARDGYAFVGSSAEFAVVDVQDVQHPAALPTYRSPPTTSCSMAATRTSQTGPDWWRLTSPTRRIRSRLLPSLRPSLSTAWLSPGITHMLSPLRVAYLCMTSPIPCTRSRWDSCAARSWRGLRSRTALPTWPHPRASVSSMLIFLEQDVAVQDSGAQGALT